MHCGRGQWACMVRTMHWISPGERRRLGRARRRQARRRQHDELHPGKRPAGSLELLARSMQGRVPALIALKYEMMLESPFAYFRGAAPVMAADLAMLPNTGIDAQLCGDAHVRNLGSYAGPDGRLVFDINDFDETIRGPFEWDVKRMAASIHVAAREGGESEGDCREAVRVFLHRYARAVTAFAAMPIVEIARYAIHRGAELKTMNEVFARAERETPLRLRDKLTEAAPEAAANESDGGRAKKGAGKGGARKNAKKENPKTAAAQRPRVFRTEAPLQVRLKEAETAPVLDAVAPYLETIEPERRHLLSRYRPVDVAFKVVGTGSVGLRDYVVYLEGNGPNDPLFLQIKQEVASGWAPYLKDKPAQPDAPDGQRVVLGQRAMQVQSDPFLGWTHIEDRQFLVRQLNDHKGSVNLGTLDPESLTHFADLCGELLARGHARAGDPDSLRGYLGKGRPFEKAVASFARRYADQTEADWKLLKKSQPVEARA